MTWCLGEKRSYQRTVVFFIGNYLFTASVLVALAFLCVLSIPWALWVFTQRQEFTSVASTTRYTRLYEYHLRRTLQPLVLMFWRLELALMTIYADGPECQWDLPTSRQIQFTYLYIMFWKTIALLLTAIPLFTWGFGMSYLLSAPTSTLSSGVLTVEVLVYWTIIVLMGFVLGGVIGSIVVHFSLVFYNYIDSSNVNSSLYVKNEQTSLLQSPMTQSNYSVSNEPPSKEVLHVIDMGSPKKPAPQTIQQVPSAPLMDINESPEMPPLISVQPPHPPLPPTPPTPPSTFVAPAHLFITSPRTPPAHDFSVAMEVPSLNLSPQQELPPIETAESLEVEAKISGLEEELKSIDASIEEYVGMVAKANNKLRRKLEKERKGYQDRREQILQQIEDLKQSKPAYRPIATSRIISIVPPAAASNDIDEIPDFLAKHGESFTYGSSYIPPGTSFQPNNSPIYRGEPFADPGNWVHHGSPLSYAPMDVSGSSYDRLSPTTVSPVEFVRPQVFRSLPATRYGVSSELDDPVHFVAYAPPRVCVGTTFTFSIWAFLANQRDIMHEEASMANDNTSSQMSRDILFPLRRGARAHITLTVPDELQLLDSPTKALTWEGTQTSVQYQIASGVSAKVSSPQVLLKATIVFGTRVMVLRSYIYLSQLLMGQEKRETFQELRSDLEMLEETYDEIPFGDLQLKELVGRGYFGDAYRATYKNRDVVVKTIRASEFGEQNDQIVQEFRHEAAVLNMFGHHPNIVPFVGASTDPTSTLTLVTEYLPCGTIEDQYGKHLSVPQKVQILADAAAGLLNVHDGGFIHRDIAARNCLVDSSLRAKVCDFGMCRRVNNTIGGANFQDGIGPLKYMAPESLQPPHSFSYQSDSFSFGVLIWEIFSEMKPFASLPPYMAAARVLEGERLESTNIPGQYQELMAACFQEDPSKRPSMQSILLSLVD